MTPERISKELTARQREAAAILYIHQLTGETKVRTMDDLPNWLSPEWIELPLYTHRPADRIQSDAKIIEELREALAIILGGARVGTPGTSPMKSKWMRIPVDVYHRARAALEPKKEG